MKLQLFPVLSLAALVIFSAETANAGQCVAQRLFKDEKGVMWHDSRQDMGRAGAKDMSSCKSICKRYASTVSDSDFDAVKRLPQKIASVSVDCFYSGESSGGIIESMDVAAGALRKQSAASGGGSARVAPGVSQTTNGNRLPQRRTPAAVVMPPSAKTIEPTISRAPVITNPEDDAPDLKRPSRSSSSSSRRPVRNNTPRNRFRY